MFGSAANNGQMIAEIAPSHKTTEMFLQIAQRLSLAHGRWLVDQGQLGADQASWPAIRA